MHRAILFDTAAMMSFAAGEAFDLHYEQGELAPWSGRYACTCGREIVVARGVPLPGEDQHACIHSRWRLIELTETVAV